MSNKECIIKICNISTILAFVFVICIQYMYLSMYFYAYVDDFLRWKKSNAWQSLENVFCLLNYFETKPREILLCKASCLKNHETYFLSCIYINILHMTMSLICLMEHFYTSIFFFNSQNPTFVIPNTLKYWRET